MCKTHSRSLGLLTYLIVFLTMMCSLTTVGALPAEANGPLVVDADADDTVLRGWTTAARCDDSPSTTWMNVDFGAAEIYQLDGEDHECEASTAPSAIHAMHAAVGQADADVQIDADHVAVAVVDACERVGVQLVALIVDVEVELARQRRRPVLGLVVAAVLEVDRKRGLRVGGAAADDHAVVLGDDHL